MRSATLLAVLLSVISTGRAQDSLKVGDDAPAFLVLDLQGKKHTLSPVSLVPGRPAPAAPVYLIDFFATWCKPCQNLLPHLESLQRAYGPSKLRVLLVDFMEDKEVFAKFVQEKGLGLSAAHDKDGRMVARRYGLLDSDKQALPITLLIGTDKKIALFMKGDVKDKEKALDAAVAKLLGPPPAKAGGKSAE